MTRQSDEILLGFARALRAAGVPVTQDRAHGFLAAVAMVGLDDQRATYTAGRATLCSSPDDLVRYDQVFEAYFNAREGCRGRALPCRRRRTTSTCRPPTTRARGPASPRSSRCGRGPAGPRCCGTATSRRCRRPSATGSPRCSRPCNLARRCGVRRATSDGTAARSTPPARSGPACAGWGSRRRSSGVAAPSGRAAWCCWSTSPGR